MTQTETNLARRAAFSIIELLVVIGIIGVLVAILLPALSRAREQAHQLKCASNMRQVYSAVLAYITDNEGSMPAPPWTPYDNYVSPASPPVSAWYMVLTVPPQPGVYDFTHGPFWAYVSKGGGVPATIFNCPTDEASDNRVSYISGQAYSPRNFSYSLNAQINWNPNTHSFDTHNGAAFPPLKFTRIVNPAHKILVWEEQAPNDGCCDVAMGYFPEDTPTDRHRGRGNQGFADGHVELLAPAEIMGTGLTNPDPNYCNLLYPPGY